MAVIDYLTPEQLVGLAKDIAQGRGVEVRILP